MKKERKNKKKYNFAFLLLIIGFDLIFIGNTIYWKGFHNSDIGQNLRWLNAEYDLNLGDKASNGKYYYPEDMYIIGTNYQERGYTISLIGVFWFAFSLALLVKEKKEL